MADKNIKLKDLQGNLLFPQTKGALVTNAKGETLESVEAGAQVNKIEKIKVNGVELAITSKEVDVNIPAAAEYTLTKANAADEGYAATYQLFKDGTALGDKINIPKDMVVESGDVKTVATADAPYAGAKVGDKYVDLVLANAESSHVYIPVTDLVDVYTAADATIDITGNAIKVNLTELGKSFQAVLTEAQIKAVNSGITAEKVAEYDTHLADTDIHVTAAKKAEWDGKQSALSADQLTNIADVPNKANSADVYDKTTVDGKLSDLITYEVIA